MRSACLWFALGSGSHVIFSRFAAHEERDPFRLKDRNSAPVLCFRCGKSALPDGELSSGQSSFATNGRETRGRRSSLRAPPGEVLWKSIVSCDHCTLHWHLDCLDPPLSSMPSAHKKWMCPAHVEHIAVSLPNVLFGFLVDGLAMSRKAQTPSSEAGPTSYGRYRATSSEQREY